MLDFGTDMDHRKEQEESDDLFATGEYESKKEDNAPVVNTEKEERKNSKRTPVKPPALPKYKEPPTPPPPPVKPVLRNNPHLLHRRRKAEDFSIEDKMEVSRILKAARNAAGLSVNDVESATQIRARYISALEDADYDKLPQPVYVLAYLRKLCNLYDIPEDEEEQLVRPWRNIPCELPENLPAAVQQDEDNENRHVLYRLELILLAAGAVIVIGLVVLIIVLTVSYFSGKDVPKTKFDNTKLLEIQEKPELKIPEKETIRR